MAVDYLQRLIVRGPHEDVRAFRRQIYREYSRKIASHTWTEIVPFSFTALYEMAPAASRVEPEVPGDPYELSAWPVRRIGRNQAEVRYQFQTRDLEMVGLIRVLSRARSSLTFTLATLCLDDSNIEVYRFKGRSTQKWVVPERRQDCYWSRARIKFSLAADDIYDDEDAEQWAEDEMLHEAMTHWNEGNAGSPPHRRNRYHWWNRRPLRDLATERQLAWCELAVDFDTKARRGKSGARAGVKRGKGKSKAGG